MFYGVITFHSKRFDLELNQSKHVLEPYLKAIRLLYR